MGQIFPRFTPGTNQDNTLRVVTQDYQNPVYAATLNVVPVQEKTKVSVGLLTGNVTVNIATSVGTAAPVAPYLTDPTPGPFLGDVIEFLFTADSSNRTVTFSSGFAGLASLTVDSATYAYVSFMFNGTSWVYMTATGFAAVAPTILTPAYASSIAVTPNARQTVVIPGQLTGSLSLTAVLTDSVEGDTLTFLFNTGSTEEVVTFSTGYTSPSTVVVPPSSNASVSFIYNGTSWIQEGQLRTTVSDVQTPAYAATLAITTTHRDTKVVVGALTGALSITAVVTDAIEGDTLTFLFTSDSTGGRVVTFSTNLASSGTVTPTASKFASTTFCFNGTEWIETGRAITV